MKQTFDTDSILFGILQKSELKTTITGGFYTADDRPSDSQKEDIEINSTVLTQDYHPQLGLSNVNIYVPDADVKIGGAMQKKANKARLKALSEVAMSALRGAKVAGLKFSVESQEVLAEPSVNQHFVNIRVSWNIQTD